MADKIVPFIIEGGIDISPLLEAYDQFHGALPVARSDLEKAGVIQYFEFTFELAWKTLKRVLAARGKVFNSPKVVFREAALEKLIDQPELWFEFIDERNETVHTYNKKVANTIFSGLGRFDKEVTKMVIALKTLR